VHGTEPGQPARIEVDPDIGYATFVNASMTTAGGDIVEGYRRDLGRNDFVVSVSVPAGRVEREALAVVNPTSYFVRTMLSVFRRQGIEVDGEAVDVDAWGLRPRYDGMRRLATHQSPPLSAIVGQTNTDSNNLYAEHLLRTLGARVYRGSAHMPGSLAAGAAASEPFLRRLGISPESFTITDGSGLSAMNRLTPVGIIGLLQGMYVHQDRAVWDAFYRSLPVGGLTGTLSTRYRSGDARGNVRAKTGYISGARTLSGYVTTATGRVLAFSLLCNNYSVRTSRVNNAQDEVVEMLADYEGY
jgi:D-alanyl-D-alanine carboxypeptidase/D-alanyl-D-alanine-endopeptidase (penicillin-binding protein 4)